MILLLAAVLLLTVAASGGLVMASKIFRGAMPPAHLAAGHGLLAMPALAFSAFAAERSGVSLAQTGAAILVAAAIGGFMLLVFHSRDRLPPRAIVVLHGLAAAAGIIALAIAAIMAA